MKLRIAAGLALILTACSEAPTGVSAAGPSLDGGAYVIGSGNRSDSTAIAATGSEAEKETAANANGAAAGGTYVIGSGN